MARHYQSEVDLVSSSSTSQINLFGELPTPPYRKHSKTSVDAAGAVREKAATLREQVLHWLTIRGRFGATVSELMWLMNQKERNNVAPRVSGLVKEGLVHDSNDTRTAKGRKVAEAVWTLVQYQPESGI